MTLNPAAIVPAGGSQPHENRPPHLTLNYCIALAGIFPARDWARPHWCEYAFMNFSALWPMLTTQTREWLCDHNGEALSQAVVEEIEAANGGAADPTWWADDADERPTFNDEIIDWIEAVANGEEPPEDAST